jgi:hypothetical protein
MGRPASTRRGPQDGSNGRIVRSCRAALPPTSARDSLVEGLTAASPSTAVGRGL